MDIFRHFACSELSLTLTKHNPHRIMWQKLCQARLSNRILSWGDNSNWSMCILEDCEVLLRELCSLFYSSAALDVCMPAGRLSKTQRKRIWLRYNSAIQSSSLSMCHFLPPPSLETRHPTSAVVSRTPHCAKKVEKKEGKGKRGKWGTKCFYCRSGEMARKRNRRRRWQMHSGIRGQFLSAPQEPGFYFHH